MRPCYENRPHTQPKCLPPSETSLDDLTTTILNSDPIPEDEFIEGSGDDFIQTDTIDPVYDITPSEETLFENDEYEDDTEQWFSKEEAIPPPTNSFTKQYFPSYTRTSFPSQDSMIYSTTAYSQAVPSVTSQDPDGIGWLNPGNWADSTWDGTPFNAYDYPHGTPVDLGALCSFLRPGHPYIMRGIREHFYKINPFADNTNPTPAEITNWTIETIRHYRNLMGVTVPVYPDARLHLECRWADERKRTQAWDTDYPDTVTCGQTGDQTCIGKSSGPCFDSNGNPVDTAAGHCGASFFPDPADREQYISAAPFNSDTYPELTNYNVRRSATEGVMTMDADLPWSIKPAWVIMYYACGLGEGFGTHAGPFVGDKVLNGAPDDRKYFGCTYWHDVNKDGGSGNNFRGKWASEKDFDHPEIPNLRP